jgi:hypothetical protein
MSRRPLTFFKKLSRHPTGSYYRQALESVAERKGRRFKTIEERVKVWPSEWQFRSSAVLQWIVTYLKGILTPKKPFIPATAPDYSIYEDFSPGITVGIAGDWGSGTDEAQTAADGIKTFDPDYTIHIGDIYFVGDHNSTLTNCLGTIPDGYTYPYSPVKWPWGTKGSFALNGNHEMYAKGAGYFEDFLPTLGPIGPDGSNAGQKTSFFALVFEKWIIVAVDTGYNSTGVPFFGTLSASSIPFVRWFQYHFTNPSCKLEDALVVWLREYVKPLLGDRSVVFMSHHQYFTEFPGEFNYPRPAEQIFSALGVKDAVWLWGHEHRFAGYKYYGTTGIQCHGRCVGNGGMPISVLDTVPAKSSKLLFYDNRTYNAQEKFGWNGYAKLTIAGDLLTIKYFDIHSIQGGADKLLIEEEFRLTPGNIQVRTSQICLENDFYGPTKWG